jgi:hypothetical protein
MQREGKPSPPRTQMLVPSFFWRGFFFGPFSTTAVGYRYEFSGGLIDERIAP